MLTFIVRRAATMALTMLVVSILVFLAMEYNIENVAQKVLGPYSLDESREIWLEENGYNRPLVVRYGSWLGGVLTGDFGASIRYHSEVSDVLWRRFNRTVILGLLTMAFVIPISLALGVLAGMRESSRLDRVISVTSIVTTSIPEFASAPILTAFFVFLLGWLPATSAMFNGFDSMQLILPVMVLVFYDFGYVTRMTRASMAEVMTTNYVRTAVLKGVPYKKVIMSHALRNALITPFTVIMLQFNWLLSGVIVVESFFAYKGLGLLLLEAALFQDVFLLEAATLLVVFVAVLTHALSDVGYMYLNPRIRFS